MNPPVRDASTRAPHAERWRLRPPALTAGQEAALARLGCALEQPGSLAVLAGPAGVGTTTVLRHLEAAVSNGGVGRLTVEWRSWRSQVAGNVAGHPGQPDIVIADDAHAAVDGSIGCIVEQCRAANPDTRVILAGRGRLLTLLGRDRGMEARVMLRAVLHAFSGSETAALLAAACERADVSRDALDDVAGTIHEIAGGIPGAILRLAEAALMMRASLPELSLATADIEALHRRLALNAA